MFVFFVDFTYFNYLCAININPIPTVCRKTDIRHHTPYTEIRTVQKAKQAERSVLLHAVMASKQRIKFNNKHKPINRKDFV